MFDDVSEFLTKLYFMKNNMLQQSKQSLLVHDYILYLTNEYCNYYNFLNWINVEKLHILNMFTTMSCFP